MMLEHSPNKLFTAIFILFLLACSCTNKHLLRELFNIEPFIDKKPDSVLTVLTSIDTCRLSGNKTKYHLLLEMAFDKNYIDTADVRVITPAVEYYGHHGSKEDRMKSLFYLELIQTNAGNYPDAMISLRKAKSYGDKIGDTYWRAMAASTLGRSYNLNMCALWEVENMEDALALWKEYGDSTHISIAMQNLARAYHNNHEFKRSDSLYTILRERGYKRSLLYLGDFKTDYFRYKIAGHQSSYKEALASIASYATKSDSTARAQLDQSAYRALTDCYLLSAQHNNVNRKMANLLLLSYGLLSLMALFVIIVIFRTRQRRIQNRYEERDTCKLPCLI